MSHVRRSIIGVAATALATSLTLACTGASSSAGPMAGETSTDRGPLDPPTPTPSPPGVPEPQARVLLVSVDGLNTDALVRLGRRGAPTFHRLMREGATTLNARTAVEQTETLPNHVGMVTGLPISVEAGGHGVTWNDERRRPRTVHAAAGRRVDSVFAAAARDGLTSAVYAGKRKFTLLDRSWSSAVDTLSINEDVSRLVRVASRDLRQSRSDLVLTHLPLPDRAGHDRGFMSRPYLRAVRRTDAQLDTLLSSIRPADSDRTWVVLTADHGGQPGLTRHAQAHLLANYRVPFMVWGPDVRAGGDLYRLNRELRDPGRRRVDYDAERQPIRNAAAANAITELLGLDPVRGSRINADASLDWS